MLCALAVAVVGCLYLFLDFFSIPFVLFLSGGAVAVMGAVSVMETRAEGKKELAYFIPALCYFILALAVIIAAVVYIVR